MLNDGCINQETKSPPGAFPDCEQHLENAALKKQVSKSFEIAQQEEAFKELIKTEMKGRQIMEPSKKRKSLSCK
jgi:hypothetical protein